MAVPSGNYLNDLYAQQDTLLGLQSTYATVIAADAAMLATILASPKPTYDIDGQMVAWGDYLAALQRSIEQMQNAINQNMMALETLVKLIQMAQPYERWSVIGGARQFGRWY